MKNNSSEKCSCRINTFCKLGNQYFQQISQILSHFNSGLKNIPAKGHGRDGKGAKVLEELSLSLQPDQPGTSGAQSLSVMARL